MYCKTHLLKLIKYQKFSHKTKKKIATLSNIQKLYLRCKKYIKQYHKRYILTTKHSNKSEYNFVI